MKAFTRRSFLKTGSIAGGAVVVGSRTPAADASARIPAADASARMPAAAASPQAQRDYVALADPFVHADNSRWFFFQSASNPFGFIKLRPDTSNGTEWGSGYHPDQPDVKGFSHVHDWQIAGVQVMPTSGASVPKTEGETGWQSPRVHDASEVAQPGYHRLHLDRYGITAELTCTDRVGMHRYTYDAAGPSEIIINLGGVMGEAVMANGKVTKVSNNEVEGYVVQHGAYRQLPYPNTLYFNIRFDKPFDSLHGWADGSLANGGGAISEVSGQDMGVYARYEQLNAGAVIQMKVGLSFTSTDGARKNLEAEVAGWDFGNVQKASQDHWNEMLGRIDVRGGTPQQQVKFYTDLFHALCGRSMISDVDGKYCDNTWGINRVNQIPLDQQGKPKFAMYNHDALWLTQWNLNSILGLAYPEIYSSLIQCHLQTYQNGGLLPRGPVAGNYSLIMTSSPVTSFICGAWNKGIHDFDADLAFDAMLDAHSVGGLFDKGNTEYTTWSGAGGIRQYLDMGYVPVDVAGDGAGKTMEYAYQDWTLAQFARQLKKKGLNISQFAEVTVSSQANDSNYAGVRAVDGRPIRSSITPSQNAEWASAGEQTPWIKLTWAAPRTIHKVVLSDRADAGSNVNSGVLTFSDGSSISVKNIPADGRDKVVAFGWKRVTWVKFEATGGTGTNVGLNEIEVWDDTDVYSYLLDRSRNWRNLFDPSTGFIRPKHSDGTWLTPFDPLAGTGFVESNSWQDGFFTVHDVLGLANLMHDTSTYAHKLNYAFAISAPYAFSGDYPYNLINYGNQPGLEEAHLFSYAGYPWLTQYWVRQVKEGALGGTSTTSGYTGDEDQGQMGALSALMAMGLFEVTGGGLSRPVYDITSPIFDEITITLDPSYYPGKTFRIITYNNSAANTYIQQAKLNGSRHDNAWFYHDQLTAGGTLELWLGDKPSKQWGTTTLPPSESASNGQRPVVATTISIAGPDVVTEPSVSYTAEFTPDNTTLKLLFWSVTEPDGSATDKAVIDPNGTLTAKALTGDIVVTATAADEGGVTSRKPVSLNVPTVSVTTEPASLSLLQGTPAAFRVRLSNNDNSNDHTATVQAGIPSGWTVTPTSSTIDVPAGKVVDTILSVTPAANAAGSATLTLTAQGSWGNAQHQVPATVRPVVALVGNIDISSAEFALAPDHYGNYPGTFPSDVDFTIGTSKPATDWSYIHPGPADAWAGAKSHTFTLRFDLPQAPSGDLVFTAWLVDTQEPIPPSLALTLNGGSPTTMQMPQGGGDGYHWGDGRPNGYFGIKPTSFDLSLPASQLHTGENVITITTTSGSWVVYDAFAIARTS